MKAPDGSPQIHPRKGDRTKPKNKASGTVPCHVGIIATILIYKPRTHHSIYAENGQLRAN